MSVRIIIGDALSELRKLRDDSVHCCVTSPPYYGLRDYGTAQWEGGDAGCDHRKVLDAAHAVAASTLGGGKKTTGHLQEGFGAECLRCGARRIDQQIGLEPSPDEYVAALVSVFREVRRVLRKDGVCWINIGDSYASGGSGGAPSAKSTLSRHGADGRSPYLDSLGATISRERPSGLKPKDLIGIPWLLAFALRSDGWYLRQDIIWSKIWSKPNPMPESVTDRCTKAHEYLFLLSRSEQYFYDAEAIAEDSITNDPRTPYTSEGAWQLDGRPAEQRHGGTPGKSVVKGGFSGKTVDADQPAFRAVTLTRNKRSVWTVATAPYSEAHFATFPPALIEPCIKAGCPVGGAILDPFGGAGTTGLVADRLGRNAILIELNPEYAAMARRRIEGDAPLFTEVA